MKKTALIILNYNNVEDTINCIRSVLHYNTAPVKFIVVDNGSPRAGVVKRLDRYMSETFGQGYTRVQENTPITWPYLNQATLLVSKRNDGYACGNNKGLKLADADPEIENVMILNNDILFIEDIIPPLLLEQQKLDDCAIISPLLLCRDQKTIDVFCARYEANVWQRISTNLFHYVRRLLGRTDEYYEKSRFPLMGLKTVPATMIAVDLPSGSCMLLDKAFFRQIDWFDPNTFLYCEEDILYKKIAPHNKKVYIDCRLKCAHLGAGSTSKVSGMFVLKAAMKSQKYYVMNYTDASPLTKAIFLWSQRFYLKTYAVQQSLRLRR